MRKQLYTALTMLASFILWTHLLHHVDVRAIGPNGSSVGFAAMNRFVHDLTGVHMTLYHITDWLGLVPIGFAVGFAFLGLAQWIRRKDLRRVDRSLFFLGGFYIAVMAGFVFFESFVVNYRPVLINGCLEASYPSSTTLLVLCVMPTALMQLRCRIRQRLWRCFITASIVLFTAFMLISRLLSGVHWFSDIVGGTMLSSGLVLTYRYVFSVQNRASPS